MTRDVFTVREDDDLAKVYDLMESHHIRHVPVVDEDEVLIGLVTQRDLVRRVVSMTDDLPISEQRDLLRCIKAAEIMTQDPEAVEATDDLSAAGELMLENKFGCVPVVEGERLVGILTEADFVRHLVEQGRRHRVASQ
jgi:CBS domain-containing membrane protein